MTSKRNVDLNVSVNLNINLHHNETLYAQLLPLAGGGNKKGASFAPLPPLAKKKACGVGVGALKRYLIWRYVLSWFELAAPEN